MKFDDGIFGLYSRLYENRRDVELSLEEYLGKCSDDRVLLCGRRRAHAQRDRRAGDGRHEPGSAARPHFHEPDDQGLSRIRRFLRDGGDDRADRRLLPSCRTGARGAQADSLSAGSGRRRQILARRAAEAADGERAGLCLEGRQGNQPGLREPARPVRSGHPRRRTRKALRRPAAASDRHDFALGGQAARGIRRRHHQIHRRSHAAVAAEADLHLQDRARRREQPGRVEPCRQGRHPQARILQPERSRRLFLFGRPQPDDPRASRIRRDVQGADQDAASAADLDAGRQLRRFREYRRHPLSGHRPGALERGRMAELQEQQEQRGVHRPHLGDQGAVLPALHRGAQDL